MARPSRRLVVLIALSLLLQQFSPAYTANLSTHHVADPNTPFNDEDFKDFDLNEFDNEMNEAPSRRDENADRRSIVSLIGRYALKSVNFLTKVTTKLVAAVDLAVTITQAIKGCGAFFPKLDKNWKKYAELDAEFRRTSDGIDAQNNQATSRQIYANSSFYEYRDTREQMTRIADEQERVFKSMGPEALVALQNASFNIQKFVNDSKKPVDLVEIDRKFTKGMDLALGLIFPAATLAWPGVKRIWKSIKGTVVGKKINQLEKAIGRKIKSAAGASTAAVRKINAGKLMKSGFGQKLQKLISKAQSKFKFAGKIFKGVKLGLGAVLKLGGVAFGVWSIFSKINDCKKAADESDGSVKKMEEFVEKTKLLLANMTVANANIQEVYNEIHDTSWDEDLLSAMENIKEMMSDPLVAKKTKDSDSIVEAIQNYINGKDINATPDNNKITLSDLQRKLNAALYRVPFTLSCQRIKGETFQSLVTECAKGESGTLKKTYEKIKNLKGVDESTAKKCAFKTGELYVSFDNMRKAWEMMSAANNTYETTCLMNNKFVVDTVREQLQNEERDVNKIARAANEADGVDEIQIIIDKLLKDPSITALPKSRQINICQFKPLVDAKAIKLEQALTLVNGSAKRKVTKEEFENQKCPVPEDDDDLSKNSNDSENVDSGDDDDNGEGSAEN